MDVNEEKLEGVRVGWDGQGGCERRIEVIVKMKKSWGGGGGPGVGWGGQCGCEIEAIVKMKISRGRPGQGWGVRADVNEELKLL